MKEPKKPEKKIILNKRETFLYMAESVPIKEFNDWYAASVPITAKDVFLELDHTWEYDDSSVSLSLFWKEEIDNPKYEKQLSAYEKKMIKWNKSKYNKFDIGGEGCGYYYNESKDI
jgi:hypothetical protein